MRPFARTVLCGHNYKLKLSSVRTMHVWVTASHSHTQTKPTGIFNCSALPLRGTDYPSDRKVGNLLPACDWPKPESARRYSRLRHSRSSVKAHTARAHSAHTYPHTPHTEQYYSSPAHQLRRSQNSRSARASKRSYHPRSAHLSLPRPASDARGTAQLEGALSGHTATTSATPGLYVGL